jgi:hypothetical protein
LYLTRYRLYSATLNRFVSPDPLGPTGGLNLYAYAEGDPLSYIDPLGLCAEGGGFWGSYAGYLFSMDYLSDVGQFYRGYGDAVADTVGGLYTTVRHPILTARGLAGAIAHPVQTAKAVTDSVVDTWNSGTRGQGRVVGNALIAAATIAAPYAKSGGAANAAIAAKTRIGYHATYPEAAQAIRQTGFRPGTKPGRLGAGGTYVNSSAEGAIAEFAHHNPGVEPVVLRVRYNPGVEAVTEIAPVKYVERLPLNVDSISAPSVRLPGTQNTITYNPLEVLP